MSEEKPEQQPAEDQAKQKPPVKESGEQKPQEEAQSSDEKEPGELQAEKQPEPVEPNEKNESPQEGDAAKASGEETPTETIPEDPQTTTEDKQSVAEETETKAPKPEPGSFFLTCLNYLSFGNYYFVLAKKKEGALPQTVEDSTQASSGAKPEITDFQPVQKIKKDRHKVFVVPGSKALMEEDLYKFLKELKLMPILIQKTSNTLESLEQKMINNKDIPFAIVLLTKDDFVYPKDSKPEFAKLRARQDVVFKLGFLLAKLSRNNVFVLYYEQKSFLLPTEYNEAVYIPFDKIGLWKRNLIERLKICGYPIGEEDEKKA